MNVLLETFLDGVVAHRSRSTQSLLQIPLLQNLEILLRAVCPDTPGMALLDENYSLDASVGESSPTVQVIAALGNDASKGSASVGWTRTRLGGTTWPCRP